MQVRRVVEQSSATNKTPIQTAVIILLTSARYNGIITSKQKAGDGVSPAFCYFLQIFVFTNFFVYVDKFITFAKIYVKIVLF